MNFQLARTNMVAQQVRPWHVMNENVLSVLSQVPREAFVSPLYHQVAYSDTDIPLLEGQTMLSPKVVGRALQALALHGKENVLEVGTGTGYVTACLSKMASKITSVEIFPELFSIAEKNLNALNCRYLNLNLGNAVLGWESEAPYDAIIITGSYPLGVPEKVCEQLKIKGGRLFAIIGEAPTMKAVLIERFGNFDYTTTTLFETVVPALVHAPLQQRFQF
jgi:protein-L-isoaspartate(D-aspartate) O-methyltransferase